MAAPYKKTVVKSFQKIGEKVTSDTLYWKNLEIPITKKEYGAITDIEFSPVWPYPLAVTNSTRVQIYSSTSLQIHRTISNFKLLALGGSYRDDGKLLVAGGDEGLIRLFDVDGKAILRVFKGHTGPVHVSKFLSSRTHIMSGSDDCSVRIWDMPSETETVTYTEHKDYVRCGVTSQASRDIMLTGSYDHTVKLFDTRMRESVMSVDHGAAVESVIMFPSGGIFISAGGQTVKVWDALTGGKLIATLSNHHKTVTSLGFCSNYQRLLSGGLDGHVKIYDVGTYQVVHTLDYPGAILSLAVCPDDSLIAVGTADGLLSLQHRKSGEVTVKPKKKSVSYKYGLRGKTYLPKKEDHVIEHKRKEMLAKYDTYLKKFEFTKALDASLDKKIIVKQPEIPVAVMQELIRRGAIRQAIAGREGASLRQFLKFLHRNISNPRFSSTLIDIANLTLDIYTPQIGRCTEVDTHLYNLKVVVDKEVTFMKRMFQVLGAMDTLFAVSQTVLTNENGDSGSHDQNDLTLTPSAAATST